MNIKEKIRFMVEIWRLRLMVRKRGGCPCQSVSCDGEVLSCKCVDKNTYSN
jgi:hypothetical protein